jgi:hypothetical protein
VVSNLIREMVFDAIGYDIRFNETIQMEEEPNANAQISMICYMLQMSLYGEVIVTPSYP